MASVEVEASLKGEVKSIDFDFKKFRELFSEIEIPKIALDGLRIYLRKSAPSGADFLTKRIWHRMVFGIYRHSPAEPQIHINIPLIKSRVDLAQNDQYTRTFLHESGHLVDYHRGERPKRSLDYGIMGAWIAGSVLPPSYFYSQNGNILATVAIGTASILSSTVATGKVVESLQKRGRTYTGILEKSAADFAEANIQRYPEIISVT